MHCVCAVGIHQKLFDEQFSNISKIFNETILEISSFLSLEILKIAVRQTFQKTCFNIDRSSLFSWYFREKLNGVGKSFDQSIPVQIFFQILSFIESYLQMQKKTSKVESVDRKDQLSRIVNRSVEWYLW